LNYFSVEKAFFTAQSRILDKVHSFPLFFLAHQRVTGLNIVITSSSYYPGAAAPFYYSIKTEPMESSS